MSALLTPARAEDTGGTLLAEARYVAEQLLSEMRPHCERSLIAGSVRREKAAVKDVEIVAVPRCTQAQRVSTDLFAEPTIESRNHLHEWALHESGLHWIKPGTREIVSWPPKIDGRYWRAVVPGVGLKLDLFLPRPDSFGAQLLIRTGCAEFSQAVMIHAKHIGLRFADGALWRGEELLPTPDEETVFRLLRLDPVPPCERTSKNALRAARGKA